VRELENEIERAVAMAEEGETIEICHLSDKIRETLPKESLKGRPQGSLRDRVETLERSILSETLKKHRDNKTKAARELGLSRYGLLKKMQRYGLLILLANHLVIPPIPWS
jgi:transcriptional regulator with PAS, ATPase and Fis domain